MDSFHFNLLDFILFAAVIFIGLRGFIIGFVKEVLSIVGIVGGVAISSRYAEELGNLISANVIAITNESYLRLAGFMIAFSSIWIASVVVGEIVNKIRPFSFLSFLSFASVTGFLAGVAKGFLLVSLVMFIITDINFIHSENFKELKNTSPTANLMVKVGKFILKLDRPTNVIKNDVVKTASDIKQKAESLENGATEVVKTIKDTKNKIEQN